MPGTAFNEDAIICAAPVLSAGAAQVVPFSRRHLTDQYIAWLNDPDVVRFSENRHRTHSLEACTAYVLGFSSGPSLLWAIETTDLGHVGNVTASVDPKNRNADIGILIGDARAKGRGLGKAVWSAVLDFLCGEDGLDKVTGGCLATNIAMVRIMQQSGMIPDGKRSGHYLWEGKRIDLVYFARFLNH